MTFPPSLNNVILYDQQRKTWLQYSQPLQVIQTNNLADVLPLLRQISSSVNSDRQHAAGFISYEAAPAFDSVLRVRPQGQLPLVWFGIYDQPEAIELPFYRPEQFTSPSGWRPNVLRAEYARAIKSVKDYIASGYTYQVNYTMRFQTQFEEDPWHLFLYMTRAQKTKLGAYINLDNYVISSASPELFFTLEGETITGKPMKGTAPRGLYPADDTRQAVWLHNSEKNRAENVMIVDMIRNDLGRIAQTGTVKVASLFEVERYPTVWQMTSTVTAQTRADYPELFTALFPCASITGAPKPRTMHIIQELENMPRQVYTGAIGFLAPGRRAQFNVAIRTVLLDKETKVAEYGVGGGIVWDSEDADEYQECEIKARFLFEKRPAFSLLETLLWEPDSGYFLLQEHLSRMEASADFFDYPFPIDGINETLFNQGTHFSSVPYRIRLILDPDGHISCQAEELSHHTLPEIIRLKPAATPVHSRNKFLYHKTTNRAVYEEARNRVTNCDDVLLWNERGEVTETTFANLIFELDKKMVTPALECGLLAGVYRNWLINKGLIQEGTVTLSDLNRCSAMYIINSVRRQIPAVLQTGT